MGKKSIGSSFDSWLEEEGIREEVTARAIKRVLARQIEAAMKEEGLSKTAMAERMDTNRSALDRLLDPENEAVTLGTLQKAAVAIGRQLRLELVQVNRSKIFPARNVQPKYSQGNYFPRKMMPRHVNRYPVFMLQGVDGRLAGPRVQASVASTSARDGRG